MKAPREPTFVCARRDLAPPPATGIPEGLACPGCGGPVIPEAPPVPGPGGVYGILSCECSRYPVIAGIPIIMASLGPHAPLPVRRLCRLVQAEAFGRALSTAVEASLTRPFRGFRRTLRGTLARVLSGRGPESPTIDEPWLRQPAAGLLTTRFPGQSQLDREIRQYFVFRPAHAEHVAAMGLAQSIRPADGPVLDLGAGAGHMAAHLMARGIPACGADRDFLLLLVARLAVAPGASFVCCDLEEGLPFADSRFGGVISVNTVHFLRNKTYLATSIERVLRDGAPVLICALRHSADPGAFRNFSLPPEGYARVFEAFSPYFFPTDAVVDRYRQGRAPGGQHVRRGRDLLTARFVEMAGSKGTRPAPGDETFEAWPHASGTLGVNPLYQPAPDEPSRFRLTIPSDSFAADSRHLLESMPGTVHIEPEILAAIRDGRRVAAMRPLVDELALIHLPAGYGPDPEATG